MSDYTKTTDFAVKSLATDILGAEWDVEFRAIATAVNSKQTGPRGAIPATTADPGTIEKNLYPKGYSSAHVPDLREYGGSSLIYVTAPSGTETLDQTANMSDGQLLPMMMAAGSPTVAVEEGVGFYGAGDVDATVSLLLHADGVAGPAAGQIVDSSYYGRTDASVAVALQLSGAPAFGSTCLSFVGGLSASLRYPLTDSGPLDITTGVVSTTEGWIKIAAYPDGTPTSWTVMDLSFEGNMGYFLRVDTAGKLVAQSQGGWSDGNITSTASIPFDTWTHWAVVDDGTNCNLYLAGVKDSSGRGRGARSGSKPSGKYLWFGGNQNSGVQDTWLVGNLDEIRISKDIARYTATFTPPAAPFPSGTVLNALSPGSGQTGPLPWVDLLRNGSRVYIMPNQHQIEAETTALVWVAA